MSIKIITSRLFIRVMVDHEYHAYHILGEPIKERRKKNLADEEMVQILEEPKAWVSYIQYSYLTAL